MRKSVLVPIIVIVFLFFVIAQPAEIQTPSQGLGKELIPPEIEQQPPPELEKESIPTTGIKEIPPYLESGSSKDPALYSEKEAFLISDKHWEDVLSLVPLTTWTGEENWCQRGYG
ncbi:MAG: hypothetical protein KKD94_05925, partial [Nanoarchaeota archaeon]|nr:hypothetical protein [Nanoarchaeota archaeon]MBU1988988.1 hypothetical protein [Nanoarchaeota archaeon]